MAYYKDHAPVGHTCPKIDQVIGFLEKIDWDMGNEDEKDLDAECKQAVSIMEEIRKANDALRAWGNEEYNDKNEYEKERDELEREVKNLKSDLSDMAAEIKDLKAEIEALEDKAYEETQYKKAA